MSDHEILTGANAVWVNDATGHCIGRFGRLGIDVHHPANQALAEPSQAWPAPTARPGKGSGSGSGR